MPDPSESRWELERDRIRNLFKRPHLGVLHVAEDVVHYAVALVLVTIAIIVLYNTAKDLINSRDTFSIAATTAVNGVLFAVIILEIMRTVVAHFENAGLQLQPFLIIGIISSVREILTVGARLSLNKAGSTASDTSVVHTALLELGVNAGVVVGLALALVLIRRVGGMVDDAPSGRA